jgi:signal peptidase II
MRRAAFYGVACLVLLLDQATKVIGTASLDPGAPISIIPGALALTLVHNTGSAFGLFRGSSTGLAAFAACLIVLLVWLERRGLPSRGISMGFGLVLGGALGNLADRFRLGYVVDFVDVQWKGRNVFPVFNVADSAITVGAVLIVVLVWNLERRADGRHAHDAG